MKKSILATLLFFHFGHAQFVYTDADYSFDYTCNVYHGTLASDDYNYDQLFATPVYAIDQCTAVEDWFPGRSCYPQANRVTKRHYVASGIDDYTYYLLTPTSITRLGHYSNGFCENYGASCTLPQTINCGGGGTDFSVGLTHSFVVCSTETHSTGTEVDKIAGFGGVGGPGSFSFSFVRTVHPSLSLRFITSSGATKSVMVYSYPGIAWLSTANHPTRSFALYPNPTENFLTISNPDFNTAPISLSIHDCLGNVILERKATSENETLDISNFASGLYFISFKDQNKNLLQTQKIIKR